MLKANPTAVHRLVDMLVEEVSLVDRAANQRRFLVVKRDEPMSEPSTPDSPPTPADVESLPSSTVDHSPTEGPLGVAFAALQSLTDAVEMIGDAGDDQPSKGLASLAAALRAVAQQLDQAVGGESSDQEDESEEEESATVDQTMSEVRILLASIQAMIANAASAAPAAPQAKTEAPPPPPDTPVAKAEATGELGKVESLIRTLTDAVSASNKRLAKLEKSFGLPNSNPYPERPARGREDKDVGWPLDMNKPMDRESVDKATSFHS